MVALDLKTNCCWHIAFRSFDFDLVVRLDAAVDVVVAADQPGVD